MKQHGVGQHLIAAGILVILAGILLFAFNAGLIPLVYKPIIFSWPMLLVAIGITSFFNSNHGFTSGFILIIIGTAFLFYKFGSPYLGFEKENIWPLLLIFIGIIIIIGAIKKRHFKKKLKKEHFDLSDSEKKVFSKSEDFSRSDSQYIERNYILGGGKERVDSPNFKGGDINCVFGGMELDLSNAQLADGVNQLEINVVMGGVVLYIPQEWKVKIVQSHVFGGFVDNRPQKSFEIDENKTLVIKISSVFGGGEIKCYE